MGYVPARMLEYLFVTRGSLSFCVGTCVYPQEQHKTFVFCLAWFRQGSNGYEPPPPALVCVWVYVRCVSGLPQEKISHPKFVVQLSSGCDANRVRTPWKDFWFIPGYPEEIAYLPAHSKEVDFVLNVLFYLSLPPLYPLVVLVR